jgi:hypothetical protein
MVMSWWQWVLSIVLSAVVVTWAAKRERRSLDDSLEMRWYFEASLICVPWSFGAMFFLVTFGEWIVAGWRAF